MRFEDATHLDWERRLQAPVTTSFLTDLMNWVYIWGHWPVIIAAGILLFRARRDRFRLLRNAMLVSGGIFLFFALFPVAPPRLVDPALADTVTLHSDAYRPPAARPDESVRGIPEPALRLERPGGHRRLGSDHERLAADARRSGPIAMGAAVVVTANHYVIDVLAGFAVVFSAWPRTG